MRKPVTERVNRHRERNRQSGLIRVELNVPAQCVEEIREIARKMRLESADHQDQQ